MCLHGYGYLLVCSHQLDADKVPKSTPETRRLALHRAKIPLPSSTTARPWRHLRTRARASALRDLVLLKDRRSSRGSRAPYDTLVNFSSSLASLHLYDVRSFTLCGRRIRKPVVLTTPTRHLSRNHLRSALLSTPAVADSLWACGDGTTDVPDPSCRPWREHALFVVLPA